MQHVGPDAVPQELDRALRAVSRQNTGAAELEKPAFAVAREQRSDIVFAGAVEAAAALGDLLAQQPVGTDHDRLAGGSVGGVIDDDQMIADRVVGIDVALRDHLAGIRHSAHFFVEHAIAKFLRAAHVGGGARQPNLERAEPPQGAGGL